jgi:hypothetical protein
MWSRVVSKVLRSWEYRVKKVAATSSISVCSDILVESWMKNSQKDI